MATILVFVLIIIVLTALLWLFSPENVSFLQAFIALAAISFWVGIIYVAGHFIIKYW